MSRQSRTFEIKPAVRARVPLFIGLYGPSGSGKTYSALALAEGVRSVFPGDIVHVDTENGRATHYADQFAFKHIDFQPPFGSLDYLDVLRYCAKVRPSVIIVDSMSHEHEGPGGMIDFQEQEMRRMATDRNTGEVDWQKAERVKMLAWQKPKAARRELLNEFVRFGTNIILCFRAKETSKPVKVLGENGRTRTEVESQGFVPIGGPEFVYEMTMSAYLPPNARGIPQWQSEFPGERMMIKLPRQFEHLFRDSKARLSEAIGRECALWAAGDSIPSDSIPSDSITGDPAAGDSVAGDPAAKVPPATGGTAVDRKARGAEVGALLKGLSAAGRSQVEGYIAEEVKATFAKLTLEQLDKVEAFARTVEAREASRKNGAATEPALVAAGAPLNDPGGGDDDPFADN